MVTRWTKAKRSRMKAVLSLGLNMTTVNDHGRPDDIFKLFSTHFTVAVYTASQPHISTTHPKHRTHYNI